MKEKSAPFIIISLLFSLLQPQLLAQSTQDSISKNRLPWTSSALGVGYGTSTYLLNKTWYEDYPRSSFHFFNDWGEWNNMDKLGHIYASQFQSNYAYHLYKWTGLDDNSAIAYGALTSLIFQSTVEVLDGFSSEWGFSVADFGANIVGTSLFVLQQSMWSKQNIVFKVSGGIRSYDSHFQNESGLETSMKERADNLFGQSAASRFLKDYNAQTYWASFNINELTQSQNWPKWLNLAIGYGAENLYGGFTNQWIENGENIVLPKAEYPRFHQYYFAPDIDLTKIQTKSPFLKALLGVLNIFKIPLPTMQITSQGDLTFHFIKF